MKHRLLAAALLGSIAVSALAASPVEEARALMQKGQATAAWELLAPLEGRMAGDPDFDYLLGISALDAGQASRAVMALERVLVVDPANTAARADLARAYLAGGESSNAEEAFRQVAREDIPPAFKANVERYLNALAQGAPAEAGTRWTRWIETGIGYDSNVNSATSETQVALPLLGAGAVGVISPLGQERDDWFLRVAGGIGVEHSLDADWTFVGGLTGMIRELGDSGNSPFETYDLSGLAGLRRRIDDASNLSGSLFYQDFGVDHQGYREAWGANGQYVRSLDQAGAISAQVQWVRLTYPDQSIRDADRWQLGLGYARSMDPATTGFVGLAVGQEEQDADARPDLGHDFWSLRVGVIRELGADATLRATARHEQRDYGGIDLIAGVGRDDRQTELDLAVDYAQTSQVTWTPKLSWTNNDSNSTINDYSRTQASVSVRYNFD